MTPTQIVAALPSVPPPIRAALDAATEAWVASLGPRLVSIVLFGSVARGEDERQSIGSQERFDQSDGARALENLQYVGELCARLLREAGG